MPEFEWYRSDWKSLRSSLVKLSVQCIDAYRRENGESAISMADAGNISTRIQREVAARVRYDELGMWEHALPLLATLESAFCDIKREFDKSTDGGVSWRSRVGSVLKQYFESSRREIIASDRDVNPNRIKTWERLDQLSRQVAKLRGEENRCHEEHFEALAGHVRVHHARDKNLPKKVSTIETYFWEFSNDCVQVVSNDDASALSPGELEDLFGDVGLPELAVSIEKLDPVRRDVISFEYDLGISDIAFTEKDALLRHHDLSAQTYDNLVLDTLRILQSDLQLQLGMTGSESR